MTCDNWGSGSLNFMRSGVTYLSRTLMSTMTSRSGRTGFFSVLDEKIGALNASKELSDIPQVKAAFGSASALLFMIKVYFLRRMTLSFRFTHIQDSMADEQDYVDLGLNCAHACTALEDSLIRQQSSELDPITQGGRAGRPPQETIDQLTM